MEPSKPLFEVGETVILQPLNQACKNLCGTETDVLYRVWGFYPDHRGVHKWRWGYVTSKMPPGFYVNEKGEQKDYLGWCEENLRKKYQAGTNFTELMAALKEDVPVEHIECLPMKERQKPAEHARRLPETVKMIQPFKENERWVFDDESKGLVNEPFVGDTNKVIDLIASNISVADWGFLLYFSEQSFSGYTHELIWQREENGGNWYACKELGGTQGWLCPALFKYFTSAPGRLFVKAEADPFVQDLEKLFHHI